MCTKWLLLSKQRLCFYIFAECYHGSNTSGHILSYITLFHVILQKPYVVDNINPFGQISSVQSLSCVQLFATPWAAARQASLSLTISRSLPKFVFVASVMTSSHLILSVQFSRSVVSDSFPPHGLQHAMPPCPSPTPGACSNSCPLSQ